MTKTPGSGKNKLDMKKRLDIYDTLKLCLTEVVIDETTYYIYIGDNNDATIAARHDTSEGAVGNTRRTLFGGYPPMPKVTVTSREISARVEEAFIAIHALRSQIDNLSDRLTTLENALGVTK